MKPLKAKVKCETVIGHALQPFAVITATFRDAKYVWLDYEERVELAHLWQPPYVAPQALDPFPILVRGHAIDSETGEVSESGTLSSRRGTWLNAEGLWVRIDVARVAVEALDRWRSVERSVHEGRGTIAAPNWRCLTAVRALAIGAGMDDPGVNWEPAGSKAAGA